MTKAASFCKHGVHCLRHMLGPIFTHSHALFLSRVLRCSLTHTSTLHKSTSGGCKAISGNTRSSCPCHLKCSLHRAWENVAPGARLSEAGDRRGRVGTGGVVHRHFHSTSCLNLLLVSHGGNNSVAFGHCHKSLRSDVCLCGVTSSSPFT